MQSAAFWHNRTMVVVKATPMTAAAVDHRMTLSAPVTAHRSLLA
jgi:hypothetical protein